MTKYFAVIAIVVVLTAVFVLAQTTTKKSAAAPNIHAPTKVTGDGVRTPSGLVNWYIRVDNGAAANEWSRVRGHYTGWPTNGQKFHRSMQSWKSFDFTFC